MAARYDLGFLGGGQLARMSIHAAQRMGLRCLSLDPGEDTPASQVAPAIVGKLADPEAIARALADCDRVTLENEFIPAEAIREAMRLTGFDPARLIPGVEPLAIIQDKLRQREVLSAAGVPGPRAFPITDGPPPELAFPMMLKSRFGGYDGKGTRLARTPEDFEAARDLWGAGGWMAEEFVRFERELAVMVYVGPNGTGTFPTMETVQAENVCDLVFPCDADGRGVALAAIEAIGGRGLFGVELFQLPDGTITVNEIAPRPHNTGHYTLDWGGLSQFDVHVRLVAGLPVPPPSGVAVCMANLLGQPGAGSYRPALAAGLDEPTARVHWYGKAQSKPGRKMGHLNVVSTGPGDDGLVNRAVAAREAFYRAWRGA